MVTLALAKQHLEYEDDDRDDLINQYIAAAAGWVESFTGLLLTRRAVTRRVPSGCSFFDVAVGPDPVIDSLTYLDSDLVEQTVPPADYALVNGRIYPVSSLPYARYGFVATITAGYDTDAPADLTSAQLLVIGHLFANREEVREAGRGMALAELPLGALALAGPYRALLV